ncbi:hypothetical protein EJB05_15410 [Eragrostis curvula]|uniref:DUF506 domain-containing protein n=1 Tax=Eragrostis curvula TaxID=38414 RepID=A0A5J9W1T5_9POAL|nr:hypothetical protein EJB05_15410 [Eragrostis curvula]
MTFRFPAKNAAAMEGTGRPATPSSRVSVFRRLLVRVTPAAAAGDGGGGGKEIRDKLDEMSRPPPAGEAEVGSAALDRMVLSFMEDAAVERPPRGRCSNCFNGNHDASDDEEFDFLPSSSSYAPAAAPPAAGDALELLKGLVQCASTAERNLLADASRIAERHKGGRTKKADVRRLVADGLRSLGYDAAVCTSRWEKSATHPAGEHEYIDAVVGPGAGERLVVEVDFRSEFEVARPTKAYRAALQALPPLFVGTPDRAARIVAVVAEAARQSLRKRGLHFPPWRKPEYMRAKWTAPHARAAGDDDKTPPPLAAMPTPVSAASFSGEFELQFDDKMAKASNDAVRAGEDGETEEKKITVVGSPSPLPWRPVEPEASNLQSSQQPSKGKVVTGLASVL